jgi:hypothetical protein
MYCKDMSTHYNDFYIMKRSKILIGLGTSILSATGAFASAKTFVQQPYWFKGSMTALCTSTMYNFECSVGGIGCLGTSGASLAKQLYSRNDCRTPLKDE